MSLLIPLAARGTAPIFEHRTPVGFSTQDSTTQADFVEGQRVTVRVDLNQAATPTNPVIGHFHNLETSKKVDATDTDGLRTDIAVDSYGTLHMAWISQETAASITTPVYYVRYAQSRDHGNTFSDPVSVSGSLRFDILTLRGNTSRAELESFSTLDVEVDSRGNPRVVYAMNFSADGHRGKFKDHADNVYFNYSETGGASWLPGNDAIIVSDVANANSGARHSAFPRMAIDQRDNIFITYVRGSSRGEGDGANGLGRDDIMLSKVDRSTTPFTMHAVGAAGNTGGAGGVRVAVDNDRQTGPDIAVGSGDVLHLIYFNDTDEKIEHKTILADSWNSPGSTGWNQSVDGKPVDLFTNEAADVGTIEENARYYFPTVVVDRQSSPNRVYALYKFADAANETIFFNSYIYDNGIGGNSGWNTTTAAPVWSTGTSPVFSSGTNRYNIELDWTVTERVAAVVDDYLTDRGLLHIAFSAGLGLSDLSSREHDIYYGFYNGVSWTLPEKVADDDAGIQDGVTDTYLSAPALTKSSGDENVYMAFSGGTRDGSAAGTGEGLGVAFSTDVNHHAYFKRLGRAVTWEDQSVPNGAYAYDLHYTPVNPHNVTSELVNNLVSVHVADNSTGGSLGATGKHTDGFLAGNWEHVGAGGTLADDQKAFDGKHNEEGSSYREWGDHGDKIGLLAKLNVLGSDAGANVQIISNSNAVGRSHSGVPNARSVHVAANPTSVATHASGQKSFFVLGADIDIIDSNTAPLVQVIDPDGSGDVASLSYLIRYRLTDPDDGIASGQLKAALYYAPDSSLATVQDVQIFGTLIADQNDNSNIFSSGTDDFQEGSNQTYSWGVPSSALKNKLFANIQQALSGSYYIYLVADDQKNPPVFSRSPGAVTILHKPIVEQVDPTAADTVDTGVRSGAKANPYDLDFYVRDFDRQGTTQVQLFYSAVSGLSSVSTSGFFPAQKYVLGKSVAGRRAVRLTNSDTLNSSDIEFGWDVTANVCIKLSCTSNDSTKVAEGSYYLYVVASDSSNVTVGQSIAQLAVKHSPSFTFYEPPEDTHRRINTGSQPTYTIQWQKGRGDYDFDDNANIDLYYTTDAPLAINYEDYPDSLLLDSDTRIIVTGLSEDSAGASDMFVWNFRNPPGDVPRHNTRVYLYAVLTDARKNRSVRLGGALTLNHDPYINLINSTHGSPTIKIGEVMRLTWDDYLVDDGLSTDNAYIRLYAAPDSAGIRSNILAIEKGLYPSQVNRNYLINSTDGTLDKAITVREDSADFFDWNTRAFGVAGDYKIYAAISKDPTFVNNTTKTFSTHASKVTISNTLSTVNISTAPTKMNVAVGDTLTVDVMVYYPYPINLAQIVLTIPEGDNSFSIIDQGVAAGIQPFVDLNNIFPNTSPIENTYLTSARQLRFSKSSFIGATPGTTTQPAALARIQLVALTALKSTPRLDFVTGASGTVLGQVGRSDPVKIGAGITANNLALSKIKRGQIALSGIKLEGRTAALAGGGTENHGTLLDVHLRLPGSAIDINDTFFRTQNDHHTATSDTVEVRLISAGNGGGGLTLMSVPPGRYVLTVKDTSHLSARTDTIDVVRGVTKSINMSGFFGSDLRGDPTSVLSVLSAGDCSQDNEINEDDVNIIIAAWGTNVGVANFHSADINNDKAVGAADLTVTTSNFGNSEGFGAPPVYKALRRANRAAIVELEPLFDLRQQPVVGGIFEVAITARELDDLAGYEFAMDFDRHGLRLLSKGHGGDVFAANPQGAIFEMRQLDGRLEVIGARIGKEWSAHGVGTLAHLRFKLLEAGALQTLTLSDGILLDATYGRQRLRSGMSLSEWLLPTQFELEQNHPNPFNPSTAIPFALMNPGHVRLVVYNVLGQRVRTLVDGPMNAGYHRLVWHGRTDVGGAAASGIYFYLIEAASFTQTRKMTLVK